MIATSQQVNPLARFVTKEAIALHLKIEVARIKEIRLWPNVILVVAQGLTRFVSYADIPPIIEVEPPQTPDFSRWRKRWNKSETKRSPEFWEEFYRQKFCEAASVAVLQTWGRLVGIIKSVMSQTALESLRTQYAETKNTLQLSLYLS
ncbi:MAG: hypothetical protein KME60_31190 [Cyanomargarita calcarea GSE-NOS-MK-12-04C]|jgi:hypothetical protein|uniref:Uncharacterized protein n=1 Tax=Cyanomargarita calcarea GSE-NOS-MK-12-04C TaxID=2839659 RepID=A0A951QWX5_9CYAN|nr:hypothetical protein [Cyanomargarita calcarea GSE-NOS-MK-12-04C]